MRLPITTSTKIDFDVRARVQRYSKSQLAAAFRDLYYEAHADATEETWLQDLEGRLLLQPVTPETFR